MKNLKVCLNNINYDCFGFSFYAFGARHQRNSISYPNDILGLLFYITASLIAGFLVIGIEPLMFWGIVLKFSVAFGALLSLFFTYLQWRVIKAWCFWCLMSAFTVWLMGIIILVSNIV